MITKHLLENHCQLPIDWRIRRRTANFSDLSRVNEERKKLAFFYSKLALLIEQSNCIVICSFVALFHSVQEHTRLHANDYFEIFLDPSLDELVKINKKGLYSDGSDYMLHQFTKHEFPKNPELRLKNIVNGIYQDDLNKIKNILFEKFK